MNCYIHVKIILNKKTKTITIEYILIDGVNDSIEHAKELLKY